MNVEEKLRQARSRFPLHTVDKDNFIKSFWTKVEVQEKVRTAQPKRHRKLMVSTAAVLLASGFACFPGIASAVDKVTFVHVVLNWVKGTNSAPYVRSVQQSSTDHGITMTITDVLYGPSQLSFGYIISPGQSGFPNGGAVQLGAPYGIEFFINGKQLHLQGIGEDETTTYGFKGLVTLTNDGTSTTLPSSFNVQIVLHKIGNQRGTWQFSVPVSRNNMKPEQTFLPMVTKRVGDETITVKEVQLYPTGGIIDYDVTAPAGVKTPVTMTLYNQDKHLLDSVTANPRTANAHSSSDGLETWSYSQPFRTPGQKPTSLIIRPSIASELEPRFVPLTGPFPVTINNGVFGEVTVTGADIKGDTVFVYYETDSNPNTPGLGIRLDDITHPNQNFGANLGEKVGASGSHKYVNVYQFSSDVTSDKMVLQLPVPIKDVFEVPLR